MNYKTITNPDEIDIESWNQFLSIHPESSFFQSPAAFEFYNKVEGYKPITIFLLDNDILVGLLLGVIVHEKHGLKGYFSRRCIVWGGPLALGSESELITEILLLELNKILTKDVIYIEFRNLYDMSKYKNAFIRSGYTYQEYLNFIIKTISLEANIKLLKRQRRQQITTSKKLGAEIIEPEDIKQVYEFYLILKDFYNSKVKKPLPPISFFEEFYKNPKAGKYFLIKYKGKIVDGVLAPIFKDTIYTWYGNIAIPEYREIQPGTLSTWASIEYACLNGFKYVDFLGAGKPEENYGVRDFKAGFGGDLVNFGRFKKINNNFSYNIGKLGLKLSAKLNILT